MRFILIACLAVILTGCASQNPAWTAGNTNGVPQYIPNPALAAASNSVSSAAGAVAPVNPYAVWTDWGIKLLFGVAGAVAAGVAASKNKNAVIDTLAAGVVKQGPTVAQAVLDHASTHPTFTAVADAINSNTGANQTVTGAPKLS